MTCVDSWFQKWDIDCGEMSYWKGDTSVPLETTTIGQLVEQAAIKYPNKNAISFYGGQRLTYAEVLDKVRIFMRKSSCK